MENIKIVLDDAGVEHIIEEFAPNEFRSMPKSVWDAQQSAKAEHLNGSGLNA